MDSEDIIFNMDCKDYKIKLVNDVDDWEYFDAVHDKEEPPFRYRITVVSNENYDILAEYVREFEKVPNKTYLNNFFKKMLKKPDYRRQYLMKGSWDGVIEWNDTINLKLKNAIDFINQKPMNELRFKHFMNLKVGGFDKYSRMQSNELNRFISIEDKSFIEKEVSDENLIVQAKRWTVRGLNAQKAIRKVKTDQEIRNNM